MLSLLFWIAAHAAPLTSFRTAYETTAFGPTIEGGASAAFLDRQIAIANPVGGMGNPLEGVVEFFDVGAARLTTRSVTRIRGGVASARLGEGMATGDYNGDGDADLALVSRASADGELLVFFGPIARADLLPGDADVRITGRPGMRFFDLASLPDIHGDGTDELVVRSVVNPIVSTFVLSGSLLTSGIVDLSTYAVLDGSAQRSARALDVVGDLDGDGLRDLVYMESDRFGAVTAHVVMAAEITAGERAWSAVSRQLAASPYAAGASPVGDLDGDGFDELALVGGFGAGTAAANVLSGALVSALQAPSQADAFFLGGMRYLSVRADSVDVASGVGDINRDGAPDWVIAVPRTARAGVALPGGLQFVLGDGAVPAPLTEQWAVGPWLTGPATPLDGEIGNSVVFGGQCDGDPEPDLLVSASLIVRGHVAALCW